ncbi:MAG: Omp28 family outer membrane lipoprotein [Muribaculaceae bacterium]|nr:Omp28 family outer membrane lipoprotein [Muribaculaceae bacterium]
MKTSYLTIGLFLLAGVATGCDNIDNDERYIKVEKPVIDNPRTLLIMEFTGNNCINCPRGAEVINQIKEDEAQERVISVGLHPFGDINTTPLPSVNGIQDFRTQAATALYEYYQPGGFPTAIFNGLKSSMSGTMTDWQQRASEALKIPSVLNLAATCEYDKDSRNLTVDYSVEFLDYVNTKLNVTAWLVENHIMGTQKMPNGSTNRNYEHNHVLRASLNGDWGQELGSAFLEGDVKEGTASMTLEEGWAAENCDVVVYVYRDDNKEVEQSISVKVENN